MIWRAGIFETSLAMLLGAAGTHVMAAECVEGEALRVTAVAPLIAGQADGLRPDDVLRAWQSASGQWHSLCSRLDLAQAELSDGQNAPLLLRVQRAGGEQTARLFGGRTDLFLAQAGESNAARVSHQLLALQALANRADFAAARRLLSTTQSLASALPSAQQALLVEQALAALEADPERESSWLLAKQLVDLRESDGGPPLARALAIRGRASLLRRDLASALTDAERASQVLSKQRSLIAAQLDLLIGALDYLTSKHDAAEQRYRAAITDIEQIAPDSPLLAGALSNLAALHVARGNPDAALTTYAQALALLAQAAPRSYLDARVHYNRALALTELRRLADAERDIEAAIDRFADVQPNGPEHLQAQAQLADIYTARGQMALAETSLRALLPRLQASAPAAYNTLAVEYQLANTLQRMERREEAQAGFRVLLEKLESERPDSLRADTLNAFGQALIVDQQLNAGINALNEALQAYAARERRGLPMASALLARGDANRRLGQFDAASADLSEALALRAQLAPGSVLEAAAEHYLGRLDRARGELDGALTHYHRAIELLERERWLQSDNAELRALWTASYADFYREPLDLLLEHARLEEAFLLDQRFRGRELVLALAQADAVAVPAPATPAVLDVAAAAARLAPDQAALLYVVGETRSWSLLLRRDGIQVRQLKIGRTELREAVDALTLLLGLAEPSSISQTAAIERARRLHQQLIAPWSAQLAGVQRLLLLTDDALHVLPFAALVSDGDEASAAPRYLIERYALAYAVQPFVSAPTDTARAQSLLALGDPVLSASDRVVATTDSGGSLPTRLRGRDEAALPAARREAVALAALYGGSARALVGAQASEASAMAARTDRLHFATHVVLDPLRPLDSYILLAAGDGADGRLHASEVATAPKLLRDLVVLAGCASRQGTNAAGEGLLGLARAWHVAGARRVLGSTWAIDDAATERLMLAFHTRLHGGQSAEAALADTQRAWLAQARNQHWWQPDRSREALPFYWAGFALSTTLP